MNAETFKVLRAKTGLSQGGLADKLGVTRATINRWETGASPVADYVTAELMGDVTAEANVTPLPVTSGTPVTRNVTPPMDVSKLTPWPTWKIQARTLPVRPGWQRLGQRVFHGSIPDPIPYDKPEWEKEFAGADYFPILTKSGRVFRSDNGAEIKPMGVMPRPPRPEIGSRLIEKKRRA